MMRAIKEGQTVDIQRRDHKLMCLCQAEMKTPKKTRHLSYVQLDP